MTNAPQNGTCCLALALSFLQALCLWYVCSSCSFKWLLIYDIILLFLCLCRQLSTKGILLSGCPSVRDHTLKVCEYYMLKTACRNFYQIYSYSALGDEDEQRICGILRKCAL